jgi:translation initiation factor IF-3
MNNQEFAMAKINRVIKDLAEVGKIEDEPKLLNNSLVVTIIKK